MADYIVVPGKFNIWIATPQTSHGTLVKLGENMDDIQIQSETIIAPVYGDRNGGRSGESIEDQYLGERAQVTLELTRWDKVEAAKLLTHGAILSTAGVIPDAAIGALMRRDHCYRVCFIPVRDSSRTKNFPCAIVKENHLLGGGTKHEALRLSFTFHRAPEGHVGNKANVLWDTDTTGLPGS